MHATSNTLRDNNPYTTGLIELVFLGSTQAVRAVTTTTDRSYYDSSKLQRQIYIAALHSSHLLGFLSLRLVVPSRFIFQTIFSLADSRAISLDSQSVNDLCTSSLGDFSSSITSGNLLLMLPRRLFSAPLSVEKVLRFLAVFLCSTHTCSA